jgi:hypothetical protein
MILIAIEYVCSFGHKSIMIIAGLPWLLGIYFNKFEVIYVFRRFDLHC